MAKVTQFIQKGDKLDYTAGADIAYLDIITLSGNTDRLFVAAEKIANGDKGSVFSAGVFEFPAKAEAMAFGDTVYFDTTNNYITKTSTSNVKAGYVTEAKLAAGTTVKVKLG